MTSTGKTTRITRKTIQSWNDLGDIAETFESRFGDTAIQNKTRTILVSLEKKTRTMLKVMHVDEFSQKHLQKISGAVRYLLLFDGRGNFMFVTKDSSLISKNKYKKLKFSADGVQNSTIEKINGLKHDNILSFDNLFDVKAIVDKFYRDYEKNVILLSKKLGGIRSTEDRLNYSRVLFYRFIFLYFIQTKGFLNGDDRFLINRLREYYGRGDNFYDGFLKDLFFNVLNTPNKDRPKEIDWAQKIPFLNGGLFREHQLESKYTKIEIPNEAFGELLEFLSGWIWYVDETKGSMEDTAINPEILGKIFEKSITHRKEKGAYYTPSNLTKFITESCITSYCLDRVNEEFECGYKTINKISDKKHLEYLYFEVLSPITILDNACGSGAFILTASKLLFELYDYTWNKIKNADNPSGRVVEEKSRLEEISEDYYFRRRIITSNLYGLDREMEAIEICKLRLWLSLVSEMNPDCVEPLPNIDYNILNGNALTGYVEFPSAVQTTLDDCEGLDELVKTIDEIKESVKSEIDPKKTKKLMGEIDQKIEKANRPLDSFRMNELGKLTKDEAAEFRKHRLFHYKLRFGSVFTGGGFDIIVGNPPYVERGKLDYPHRFFRTVTCGNSYAYFIEVSLQLLRGGGYLGYIVPVSSVSTKRMAPLQKHLLCSCSNVMISNYDDRPGRLFDGLEHCRSSIILCQKKHTAGNSKISFGVVHTTGYKRWRTEDVGGLFENISYIKNEFVRPYYIPKIGERIEVSIMKKILKFDSLGKYIDSKKQNRTDIIYHNAPQYWIRGMNFMPYFSRGGVESTSAQNKTLKVTDVRMRTFITGILNSSLFYWWFIKTSDGRHLNDFTITDFHLNSNFDDITISKMQSIVKRLMLDYKKNSERLIIKKDGVKVEYDEFHPKHSKKIIDKIDDLLANIYKLNKNEANYIKNFDYEFRMGEDNQNT